MAKIIAIPMFSSMVSLMMVLSSSIMLSAVSELPCRILDLNNWCFIWVPGQPVKVTRSGGVRGKYGVEARAIRARIIQGCK
jgi:hypothetical protein